MGEMNEVADDAKDAKDPVVSPPAKKGVEIKLSLPLASEHAEGKPVKIQVDEKKEEEKKKEEKKKDEKKEEKKKEEKKDAKEMETTILVEPSKPGELSIWVEKKIGKPGDKIVVDGEMNEVAPDAKAPDGKDPPPPPMPPPAKAGVEIKLVLPLAAEHAQGRAVQIVQAEAKK